MLIHLSVLFISVVPFISSTPNTIHKACSEGSSTCGKDQLCVNQFCQCNPNERRFWTDEKRGCKVCPNDYIRLPDRCYKYTSTPKNRTEARDDCRQKQADLFSWRGNADENHLLDAYLKSEKKQSVAVQFYTWGGGIVHHGQGTINEYKITWVDPTAPTLLHPKFDTAEMYCSTLLVPNYKGDPEPTRLTNSKGETENCITFVFVPRQNARGQVCLADDYCSVKMPYLCELTATTMAGDKDPPPVIETNEGNSVPTDETGEVTGNGGAGAGNGGDEGTGMALESDESNGFMNKLIYFGVAACSVVVFVIIAYIIIRKRKQNNQNAGILPKGSVTSTAVSESETYENA